MRYSLVSAGLCLVLLLPLAAQAEMYAYIDAKGVYHYTNAPGDGRYRLTAKPVSQRRSARTATGRGSLFGQQTQPLAPSRLESTSFTRVSNEERLPLLFLRKRCRRESSRLSHRLLEPDIR